MKNAVGVPEGTTTFTENQSVSEAGGREGAVEPQKEKLARPSHHLYLDTEFNGHAGELISLAMVSSAGHEFYEVMPLPADIAPWVAENVIPKLDKSPIRFAEFKSRFNAFLDLFDCPTIVADWNADIKHFCALLEGPNYVLSRDYRCKFDLIAGPTDIHPENPHNALSDAHALRKWHMATFFLPLGAHQ